MQKMKELSIRAVKSKIITSKSEQKIGTSKAKILLEYILPALQKSPLKNGDIFVVSSKVVAVVQGRTVKIKDQKQFDWLVRQEADQIIEENGSKKTRPVTLTLKNNIFIPWAGIDRSNIQKDHAVLWPHEPYEFADELCKELKKQFKLKNFGVILVDSFCVPLRKGVFGIALGYAGFQGVTDQRGQKDLYGNTLKVTQENVVDSLATMANLVMGQSTEQTPFAVITNAPVKFSQKTVQKNEVLMNAQECLFEPLYKNLQQPASPKRTSKRK